MNTRLESLQAALATPRARLTDHPLYSRLSDPDGIRAFSTWHVFAVWDFMSLLKSLQNALTCTRPPWLPVGNPATRFLINEIVVGEESDTDPNGERISHFELYLKAMESMGADTSIIRRFITALESGRSVKSALQDDGIPPFVRRFVSFTFEAIAQPVHIQASVFTFGREDLIPDMFLGMVRQISEKEEGFALFRYYLERHIEVDGGHHGVLALQMVEELCGTVNENWDEATRWAKQSIEERILLWDGVAGTGIPSSELVSNP